MVTHRPGLTGQDWFWFGGLVDWFSKAVHLVPLAKLPSVKETAELLVQHVFRLHCVPVDVVSDRGPSSLPIFGRLL